MKKFVYLLFLITINYLIFADQDNTCLDFEETEISVVNRKPDIASSICKNWCKKNGNYARSNFLIKDKILGNKKHLNLNCCCKN